QVEFREECYVYFAVMRSPGDITTCGSVSPNYRDRCLEVFFDRTGPKSPDDCRGLFGNAYYDECVGYVNRKGNPIQMALSLVETSWTVLTSPDFVVWASVLVSVTIAGFIAYVVLKTKGKEKEV
ncbi:hypothetical protein COY95_04625, partial [Candidatus Woesearchaeota archaeon CG_4_10_14_0_8_um_filter_47_5]